MAADSDAEPAFTSVAERIAALQKGNNRSNNSPTIGRPSPTKKRSALADRIAVFQNSSSIGQQAQATSVKTKYDAAVDVDIISSNSEEKGGMDATASEDANAKNQDVESEIVGVRFSDSGAVAANEDGVVGDSDHTPPNNHEHHHHTHDSACDEPESRKESREDEINPTSNSVDNDGVDVGSDVNEDVPTDEEQNDELNGEDEKGTGIAVAAGELNMIETLNSDNTTDVYDDYHDVNMDEEHVLHDDKNVHSCDEPMEDVVTTPYPDDIIMDDSREEYVDHFQTQVRQHEALASGWNLIDDPNLDETQDVPYEANPLRTILDDTAYYSLDAETDIVQHDQTDVIAIVSPDASLGDARKESDTVQSQLGEQVVAVVGESIHQANTTQPEREHNSLEDYAKLTPNETLFTLRRDEVAPVEIDEEMAGDPAHVEDKLEEAYPKDPSPARRYRSFILIACIVVLAIIAAVIVTSVDRDSGKEPLSSSSSSTSVGEGTNVAIEPSSTPSSSPSETQEPSSIQPSFVPSTKPSSRYEWIQVAIDNYVSILHEASSRETTTPSSNPSVNSTPPPSTANPVTTKPTLSTAAPTSWPTTQPSPNITKLSSTAPTKNPSTADPTANSTPQPSTAAPTSRPTTQPSSNITKLSSTAPTKNPSTANPTANPTTQPSTARPSIKPSMQPSPNVTELPSTAPTANSPMQTPLNLAEVSFNETNPTQKPSMRPTRQQRKGCITNSVYDEIDTDIERLKNGISDDATRAHFLGGIVRRVCRVVIFFSCSAPLFVLNEQCMN
jgi:hypothetical protein